MEASLDASIEHHKIYALKIGKISYFVWGERVISRALFESWKMGIGF